MHTRRLPHPKQTSLTWLTQITLIPLGALSYFMESPRHDFSSSVRGNLRTRATLSRQKFSRRDTAIHRSSIFVTSHTRQCRFTPRNTLFSHSYALVAARLVTVQKKRKKNLPGVMHNFERWFDRRRQHRWVTRCAFAHAAKNPVTAVPALSQMYFTNWEYFTAVALGDFYYFTWFLRNNASVRVFLSPRYSRSLLVFRHFCFLFDFVYSVSALVGARGKGERKEVYNGNSVDRATLYTTYSNRRGCASSRESDFAVKTRFDRSPPSRATANNENSNGLGCKQGNYN